MATKRELKAEIETLSTELGVSIETDRLNLEGLTKLLEDLRQKAAGAPSALEPEAAGDGSVETEAAPAEPGVSLLGATKRTPPSPPAAVVAEPPSLPEPPVVVAVQAPAPAPPPVATAPAKFYRVAQGCVIYTQRGKVGAFRPIKASDLSGGQEMLDDLVRSGQVEAKR
jgi:hypothetical protein